MAVKRTALGTRASAVMLLVCLTAPASATGADTPAVNVTSATVSGRTVSVTGVATFPDAGALQDLGGIPRAGPAGITPLHQAAGAVPKTAQIGPLADATGLRLHLTLDDLPANPPPEAVLYFWNFTVGPLYYEVVAKRTHLTSTTVVDDPQGHIDQAVDGRFMELRGPCVEDLVQVLVCPHGAFLRGALDPAADQVRIELPFEHTNGTRMVAQGIKPGAALDFALQETGWGSVGAKFQVGDRNINPSTVSIQYLSSYVIGTRIEIGLGPAGADPEFVEYGGQVSVHADGSFTAALERLSSSQDTVFIRACNGSTCLRTAAPIAASH